jgi:SAM-dependent methyltransferase
VLDLGCGAGYFLSVIRQQGHLPLGLDLDSDPLYNNMIQFLNLSRVIQRIEPMQELTAEWDAPFDLITAFMTCFNLKPDGTYWGADEWEYLLKDLQRHLAPAGRLFIRFNRDPNTGLCYTEETRRRIEKIPGFSSRFYLDYLFLDKK